MTSFATQKAAMDFQKLASEIVEEYRSGEKPWDAFKLTFAKGYLGENFAGTDPRRGESQCAVVAGFCPRPVLEWAPVPHSEHRR